MTARVRRLAAIVACCVALAVTGCASDVVLLDPRTAVTATCRASLGGLNPWSQQHACIGEHIARGWVRADTD